MRVVWRVDGPGPRRVSFNSLEHARDEVRRLFDDYKHLSAVNLVRITEDPTSICRHELKDLNRAFPLNEREELEGELSLLDELLENENTRLADPAGFATRRRQLIVDRLKEMDAIASLEKGPADG